MHVFPLVWLVVSIIALVVLFAFQINRNIRWLVAIMMLTAIAGYISSPFDPRIRIDLNGDGDYAVDRTFETRLGLDLQGGLQVLLVADLPPDANIDDQDMEAVRINVQQRIDSLGVVEPIVQRRGDTRIIVELPGIENSEQALDLIQETALLEFVNAGSTSLPAGTPVLTTFNSGNSSLSDAEVSAALQFSPVLETVMTGAELRSATVAQGQFPGDFRIDFSLTSEGADIFAEYTATHIGQVLAIVLDGEVIAAPRIQTEIPNGVGTITGDFSREEAQNLVIQLRAGSLEVPLRVESTSSIGPTLGALSVTQSTRAGVIGVSVVLLFMLLFYRLPGLAADFALLIFALLNIAIFKLVPITLTLPAITGFLISIGTAVDGNVLIFERMKEELRRGRNLEKAVDEGFKRAWTSIRDSNLSTIIICGVLYSFGSAFGAGAVRGFAVTLALGLVMNLFTAIIVTRTFLYILLPVRSKWLAQRRWLLGV